MTIPRQILILRIIGTALLAVAAIIGVAAVRGLGFDLLWVG